MKRKPRKPKLHVVGKPCKACEPDRSHDLLTVEQIMEMPTTDSLSYSLKVYVATFEIGMQEFTGSANSIEAAGLLEICAENIARGHTIVIR
ncbi:MAG TPA: hypothetical protein V6C81_31160 [Planktothrix sp.]